MFKHILLPTDGSGLSAAAIKQGVRLAKAIGAKVTGLSVMPFQHTLLYEMEIPTKGQAQDAERCQERSSRFLAVIEKEAEEAGVACNTVYERDDFPYEVIIRVAQRKGCDLIVMASHGRRGVQALLLGSETQKVLTHSKIPVLVVRGA